MPVPELRPRLWVRRVEMGYYVVKVYGLICDGGDGCEASVEAVPLIDSRNKLAEVRKQLALPPDRWTHRKGKDYCPKCTIRLNIRTA